MTTRPGSIIHTENLHRTYIFGAREVPALRGIYMDILRGQFVALKGRSGSGKTTLLNCLAGLDTPNSGSVQVLGQDLKALGDPQRVSWRRDHLGLVFQSFSLLPTLSAYENVELALRIKGGDPAIRRKRALECLELVRLERWRNHRPYELSGGQQQRVAIARALANQPPIILADEPTGELDSATAREILSLFRNLVEDLGITLLVATHDELVHEYATRVLFLKDGRIEESALG